MVQPSIEYFTFHSHHSIQVENTFSHEKCDDKMFKVVENKEGEREKERERERGK